MISEGKKIRKGVGNWTHWTGTPVDLGDIGRLATSLVQEGRSEGVNFSTKVTAPELEANFTDPDEIDHGLEPEELADLEQITMEVKEDPPSPDGRRISLTITRPPPSRSTNSDASGTRPVVKLRLFGADRDWVHEATAKMKDRLETGARATGKVRKRLWACFLILIAAGFVVVAVGLDEKDGVSAGEWAALILFPAAFVVLFITVFLEQVTPQLELLPEGGVTRWERIKERLRAGGRWLISQVAASVISVAVGILIGRTFF